MSINKAKRAQTKIPKLLLKIEKMVHNWEDARNTDTFLFMQNPRRTIFANLMIGISRGVGFVIGVSIIGAVAVTVIGWVLARFVTVPIIGEYIAIIVRSVQEYLGN